MHLFAAPFVVCYPLLVFTILCCQVTRDAPGEVHSAPQCSDSALTVLKTVLGSQKHGKYQRWSGSSNAKRQKFRILGFLLIHSPLQWPYPQYLQCFGARVLSGALLEHCPGTVEHCVAM